MPLTLVQLADAASTAKACKIAVYKVLDKNYVVKICAWRDWWGTLHVEFDVGEPILLLKYKKICDFSFFGWCLISHYGPEPAAGGAAIVYSSKAVWTSDTRQLRWINNPAESVKAELLAAVGETKMKLFKEIIDTIKGQITDTLVEEYGDVMIKVMGLGEAPSHALSMLFAIKDLSEKAELAHWAQREALRLVDTTTRYALASLLSSCINGTNLDLSGYINRSPSSIVVDLIYEIENSPPIPCSLIEIIR